MRISRGLVPSVALAFLTACSTMPLSTQVRAALSPLEAKPIDIRVALIVPQRLVVRPGGAVMSVGWQPSTGEVHKLDFALQVLDGNAAAPKLLSRLKAGQRLYVLRLTDADIAALLALQREMQAAKASGIRGKGEVSAGVRDACWDGAYPSSPEPMPLEVHVRTETGGDWMPLMTGVDLKDLLRAAKIQALPSCQGKAQKN